MVKMEVNKEPLALIACWCKSSTMTRFYHTQNWFDISPTDYWFDLTNFIGPFTWREVIIQKRYNVVAAPSPCTQFQISKGAYRRDHNDCKSSLHLRSPRKLNNWWKLCKLMIVAARCITHCVTNMDYTLSMQGTPGGNVWEFIAEVYYLSFSVVPFP